METIIPPCLYVATCLPLSRYLEYIAAGNIFLFVLPLTLHTVLLVQQLTKRKTFTLTPTPLSPTHIEPVLR